MLISTLLRSPAEFGSQANVFRRAIRPVIFRERVGVFFVFLHLSKTIRRTAADLQATAPFQCADALEFSVTRHQGRFRDKIGIVTMLLRNRVIPIIHLG